MTKSLAILGSTGSIGVQSLDVCKKCGYQVSALTANRDVDKLEAQIRAYHPSMAAMADEAAAAELQKRVADTDTKIYAGKAGVCTCAAESDADTVLNSIVGIAGLEPTLSAIHAHKKIALANKETLVAGGQLVMQTAKAEGVDILPVDSEHSAIFQALQGKPSNKALKKIILTASGGPFFGKSLKELEAVTVADALKHPNWEMGAKITVDSASMMNKGLELIEAVWLFSVKPEDIDIVVHRESIVHSAVEYTDNSVIAQLGLPDMRIPIQYALTYPERYPSPVGELKLSEIGKLTFFEPDYAAFPCINLCKAAITKGGLYPAAVNSANEEANALFRQGKIGFLDIPARVQYVLEHAPQIKDYTVEDIMEMDRYARQTVRSL